MRETERPLLAITMGDPASIGPEITVKALTDPEVLEKCRPLIVGDACMMEQALDITGHKEMKIHAVSSPAEALFENGTIDVLDMKLVNAETLPFGTVLSR
ncbi:MAG: hypothetical protein Q4D24_13775 [Erysipelotrichaceae bacterium]|nr:hypothetical protein [Erysipelotrichaceae bacterium]